MRKPIVLATLIVVGLAVAPAWAGIDRVKSGPPPCYYGNCPATGYKAQVRRGLPYTLVFTGSLLQGADRVVTGGNGITGRVLMKNFTEVTIFLELAPSAPLGGRAITIQAGNQVLGAFALEIGHLGRVDSITPTTIPTGRQTVVRVLGKDIQGGVLNTSLLANLNARVARRAADEVQLELNPAATYTGSGVTIQLFERHSDGAKTLWQKAPRLAIQATLATGGEGCQPYPATDPYLKPKLSVPGNGYLFAPLSSTQTIRQINFSWRPLASSRTADKFILEYHPRGSGTQWTRVDVPASRTYQSVNLGKGVWEWRVRIGNCGQASPYSDTWSFTIQ